MSKDYSWWMSEFKTGLPVYLADWWCQNNVEYLDAECRRLGKESMLAFTGGSIDQTKVAKWIIEESKVVDSILDEMRKADHPFMKALYYELKPAPRKGDRREWSTSLEYRLSEVLPSYLKQLAWWNENLGTLRKEGRNLMAVKKIMES